MLVHIRTEWARRLRSGDYAQGKERLRDDSNDEARYCCLGVLCELAVEAGVIRYDSVMQSYYDPDEVDYVRYGGVLPPAVSRWAELIEVTDDGQVLTVADPVVTDPTTTDDVPLSLLNDDGAPFITLARLIEEQL